MKVPEEAPTLKQVFDKNCLNEKSFEYGSPYDKEGRYLHWEEIKRKITPDGMSSLQWWGAMKIFRKSRAKVLPFTDKNGRAFSVADPDGVQRDTHWLTQNASGALWGDMATASTNLKQSIYISSLFDEAISSSQLEGATTTRALAKEMLQSNKKPRDKSEKMILNNYLAMSYIEGKIKDDLSPEIIKELQSILTKGTLDITDGAGRYRRSDELVALYDDADDPTMPVFVPPSANELPEQMERLCAFANTDEESYYLDPLHKAIILHFMLAYDHPFVDGNGRTARALFYWYALKSGFGLAKYLSISSTIKKAPKKYARAFLHVETDENDLTYFLIHQLDVIKEEVEGLFGRISGEMEKVREAESMLATMPELRHRLNGRQLRLIRHGLKNPHYSYTFREHARANGVSHGSARTDLLILSDELQLFTKVKQGKAWVFVAPPDLSRRISQWRK